MNIQIKHRFNGSILFSAECGSLKVCLELALKSRADLCGANLSGADLYGADLCGANLSGADLYGANLSRANLSHANLYGANLSRADLSGADLSGADLYGADLSGAPEVVLARLSILPAGDIVGFKKTRDGVVQLLIPAAAQRVNSYGSRKCRAEFVVVTQMPEGVEKARGLHDRNTVYSMGSTVRPDSYDANPQVECTHGIHFFITKAEAEAYDA